MHVSDIQHAVINCRKSVEAALVFIKQCEADLQDLNNLEDLEKHLQSAGELEGILSAAANARELEAVE